MLFTTVAAGAAIFLALPVIFEVEEEAPAVIASQAENKSEPLTFNPEGSGADSLPILQGMQKKGNFFSNYAKKAGNFYKKGFDIITGGAAPRNMPSKDYAVFYAGNVYDDYEEFPGELSKNAGRISYDNNANQYSLALPDIKQTSSSSAGVKGLYENSLTDLDRIDQKQVYGRVAGKVNRVFPDVRPKKTAVGLPSYERQSAAGNLLIAGTDNYFISALPNTFNLPGSGFSGTQSGTGSGQTNVARQGATGAFGNFSMRPSETDNSLQGMDFGKQISRVRKEIEASAKDGGDDNRNGGTGKFGGFLGAILNSVLSGNNKEGGIGSKGNVNNPQGTPSGNTNANNPSDQTDSNVPQNSGGVPNSTQPSENATNPDNKGNDGSKKPQNPIGGQPVIFNPEAWKKEICGEDSSNAQQPSVVSSNPIIPLFPPTNSQNDNNSIAPIEVENPEVCYKPDYEGKIPPINNINGKSVDKWIANLGYEYEGKTKKYVYVSSDSSLLSFMLGSVGVNPSITSDTPNVSEYSGTIYKIPIEEYNNITQGENSRTAIFTVDKGESGENVFYGEPGDFDDAGRVGKMINEYNQNKE
jgi:hypothetical protein